MSRGSGRRSGALVLGYSLAAVLILAIIAAVLRLVGFFAPTGGSGRHTVGDLSEAGAVHSIRVDHFTGDLVVRQGDFQVETQDMPADFSCYEEDGVLVLDGGTTAGSWLDRLFGSTRPTVWLTLPAGQALEDVWLTTGAGDVEIDALAARRFTLKAGAGDVTIQSLTATESCALEGGVGDTDIYGGVLAGLEISTGVGDVTCTGQLLGDCSVSGGVGDTELTVLGRRSDYRLSYSSGVGDVEINGADARRDAVDDSGAPHSLHLSTGVGDIDVDFQG